MLYNYMDVRYKKHSTWRLNFLTTIIILYHGKDDTRVLDNFIYATILVGNEGFVNSMNGTAGIGFTIIAKVLVRFYLLHHAGIFELIYLF